MVELRRMRLIFGFAAAAASLAVFTAAARLVPPAQASRQAAPGNQAAPESELVARYRERAATSDRPIDQYNFGTALLNDGQLGEAQVPLQQSIGSERDEVRESAFYNFGLSTALDGRFAQSDPSARRAALQSAREAFRSVLRTRADDEDARWNLELVERWLEEEGESGGGEQQSGEGESPQGSGAGAAAAAGSGELQMLSPEEAAALLEQAGDAEAAIRDRVMGRNRFQDPVVERNW
ncbi:hypothetical protein [Candidatus Palauibacter sp.]|uniref:hypothetical protein n=1 Tax=Candidatus Palauibacter sp. TaxID=3101350 RepID=UPI003B5CDD1F